MTCIGPSNYQAACKLDSSTVMRTLYLLHMVNLGCETGALGYVLNLDLVRDLVTAVESVSRGRQFVRHRLTGFRLLRYGALAATLQRADEHLCRSVLA